ncbi:phasin family protein [Oxalobacteraceae bacterium]|nr:phasin family protein [Oxalobacteraceae bacterium]
MFSITEQFSAATKSQLEAQLNLINTFASKAVESAEKVIALNISTTKASVEKTSTAARQLFEVKDPRDFFTLGATQTPNLDHVLAYSRQLFSIASTAQAELLQTAKDQIKSASASAPAVSAAPVLAAPAPAAKTVSAPAKADVPPVVVAESAQPANEPVAAPPAAPKAAAKAEHKAKPASEPKAVVQAVAELVDAPVTAAPPAKPAAAPVPEAKPVELKSVTPATGNAPAKTSIGPAVKAAPEASQDLHSSKKK